MLNLKTTKILIVDDDEDDYFIIADYIKGIEGPTFIIEWCNDFDTALVKMKSNQFDIYFVDYRLGSHTGVELLKTAISNGCDKPVILLTGKGSKIVDIEAMRSGATDYLIKSELNTEKLERCIRYAIDRSNSVRALKESETKYRNLFAGSKDALFISDNDLVFKEVNDSASTLFDVEVLDLIDTSLFDFIPDEKQKEAIRAHLDTGNINDLEIQVLDEQQRLKDCLLSASVEKTVKGTSVHGILHDITNIKKVEKANLQAEKTAANERLVRILAHEIRNPLNNISLSADHIHLKATDPKEKALIEIIQRNSVRINQIITELLDSTKTVEMNFQRHCLQDILEESISVAIDRINLQKIKLVRNLPADPMFILADGKRLKIAFSNIFINAIEAMEADKGELVISASDVADSYVVSIKDNGYGIPAEFLTKLFEPFFTLKKNGMGLGLAAAYGIFKSHKANMQVKSEVNKGTNFIIDFNPYSEENELASADNIQSNEKDINN